MNTINVFSSKANRYAKYRWDYAPQAIQTILDLTQVSPQSSVADIGAGTGILTKHFVGQVKQIFAVEPNLEMRQIAARDLGAYPSCHIVAGRAEATTLPDQAVDLITVAQAIQWFEPQPTRTEFLRILKPGGWLALLRNYGTNDELSEALEAVFPEETDTSALMKRPPKRFYYGGDHFLKQTFAFTSQGTWEEFIGALSTASDAPDEGSPLYAAFEGAARSVFGRFSSGGLLESHLVTELYLGQIRGS
jgi:ubiquinone/menaquinone biosynthesis C-methylase UbiE